jgi:amino acid transporter
MGKKEFRLSLILLVLFFLFAFTPYAHTTPATREEPSTAVKLADLILIRPIGVVVSAVSTGFCVVTMPLAFIVGIGEESSRVLVETPWKFTSSRPLGNFKYYKDGKQVQWISN